MRAASLRERSMPHRVAIVTGGGRGIGRAIAIALAADGHAVGVGDLLTDEAAETAAAVERAGGRALGFALDVTDSGSVREAVRLTEALLGGIGILVNNAGWDELHPFLETDEPFWDRIVDINFKGCLRVTQAVLPAMVDASWGRLINIGSDAGRVGSS